MLPQIHQQDGYLREVESSAASRSYKEPKFLASAGSGTGEDLKVCSQPATTSIAHEPPSRSTCRRR